MIPRALLEEIGELSVEHLTMVAITLSVACAIAIPAAIGLSRRPRYSRLALGFTNILQTIPSLALFGFLIPVPFLGVGKATAIVALILYALLPILRNTLIGITGVEAAVRDSAIAMGMTHTQVLTQVELPLGAKSILTGIRIATVTTIGTATIAAAIGAGGLGVFIFRGIASIDTRQILAGAIPAALMAVIADELLGWLERRFT